MLCPRCGAYSPYNTSACNRCGAKLNGEVTGEQPRKRKYYRNARKSEWEQARERLLTKANDTLDGIMADSRKRMILFAAAAVAAIALISGVAGCVSCTCGSCAEGKPVSSPSDTVSLSDTMPGLPEPEPVSPGDTISGGDALSGSDLTGTSSDVPVIEEEAEPADDALVSITEYIPSLYVDLKYATEDNFTGKRIYDFTDPRLRYGTVKKLAAVQEELVSMGYSLIIWDAYRPLYAQQALWDTMPDANYVSNPETGYCSHSRGNTVDITLTVIANGEDVVMPTGFDDFSPLADRDYSDVSPEAAANAAMLENIMTAHGFTGYSGEWWHYSDTVEYPIIETD